MRLRTPPVRRGITSVLAMIFLGLFSVLAVGFYASITTANQVASNELRTSDARLAAESGLQFIRYQLAQLSIPGSASGDERFATVYSELTEQLAAYRFSECNIIGMPDSQTIAIPASTGHGILLDSQGLGRFAATIRQQGTALLVSVTGSAPYDSGISDASRTISLEFAPTQRRSVIFDYGIASRGPITMTGNSSVRGSPDSAMGCILSTTMATNQPLTLTGNVSISGDVFFVNPDATASCTGNVSIGGTSKASERLEHIHAGVQEPEFPTIDTSIYEPYATNLITGSVSGNTNFSNIRIKAGVNPTFSGNTTIKGVMYIETPNRVTFSGNCTIQGVIVAQSDPTGNITTNQLRFSGNVSASGPETLPDLPQYSGLRDLTGSFLLVPTFALTMAGNFGTIGGAIVADQMTFTGNAGGTVNGAVINLSSQPVSLTGNSPFYIHRPDSGYQAAGLTFSSYYKPLPETYEEGTP